LLFNFMGVFWLTSGIALLRQGADSGLGSRTSRVVALVGILTGLIVFFRDVVRSWLEEVVVFELLGAVILLTGALHVLVVSMDSCRLRKPIPLSSRSDIVSIRWINDRPNRSSRHTASTSPSRM
jgi:hypothetical protein